jgi:hypothetical protein
MQVENKSEDAEMDVAPNLIPLTPIPLNLNLCILLYMQVENKSEDDGMDVAYRFVF